MIYRLHNSNTEPITVEYSGNSIIIEPQKTIELHSESPQINIRLHHINNDKLNTAWYILTDIFALEQMRTILVVDGEYTITADNDEAFVKIKSYEYFFEKHTAYQTFIFSSYNCTVQRKNLLVCNKDKILKRAKFLYLFGGIKTFMPISAITLAGLLLNIIFAKTISASNLAYTLAVAIIFIILFSNYIKSLRFLKKAVESESIMNYMLTERKQYRKFSDEIVQQNLDTDNDFYW